MTPTSVVTRLSLPLVCALAIATDVPDAGAQRPADSVSPTAGAKPTVAKPTLAATLGTLVSQQSMHVACYELVPLAVGGMNTESWSRKLDYCYTAKNAAKVQLAKLLQFPGVGGRIFLRELRCESVPNDDMKLKLRVRIDGAGGNAGIDVEKTDSDPAIDSYEFDGVEIDPKRAYHLVVDYQTNNVGGLGPSIAKGLHGCTIDYAIVGK
ncbi:MAG TPA: hypothetical protein VG755_35905 [Nannocystaceae bacterium]|nr:hypothetical protein [Nannocystaceae bacterium]